LAGGNGGLISSMNFLGLGKLDCGVKPFEQLLQRFSWSALQHR